MKRLLCNILLFFGVSRAVYASAGGTPEINWWGLGGSYSEVPALGWLFLTFAIFIFIIAWAIKKPLGLYLEARSNDIRKAIEEGQKAKLDSEAKLRLCEDKLRALDGEIVKLKEAFVEQAKAESILKEHMTQESKKRILKDTEDIIKASFERSKNKLSEEVISSAVNKAQNIILKDYIGDIDNHLKKSIITDVKNYTKEA